MCGLRGKEGSICPMCWPSVFPFSLSSTRFVEIEEKNSRKTNRAILSQKIKEYEDEKWGKTVDAPKSICL